MTDKKIYNNRIATLFLLFYSFFLIFASFHSHKINLQNGNSYRLEESNSYKKHADPFLDVNSKCKLYYFTAAKYIFTPTIDLSVEVPEEYSNYQKKYSNPFPSKHYYNFDLRAPPSIS